MKNRKSLLGLVLLALVLVLGVGYAVVSSVDLTISGDASVADSELAVSFTDTVTTGGAGTSTGAATAGALTATFKVTELKAVGDTATVTYTIKNEEKDLSASVLKSSITNDKEAFFQVTTSVDSTANIAVVLTATPQQPTA